MMLRYELVLAHPSICSGLESQSLHTDMLKQQPVNVLRYITVVDVLAPVFDVAFSQDTVVQTLRNATFGMLLMSRFGCNVHVSGFAFTAIANITRSILACWLVGFGLQALTKGRSCKCISYIGNYLSCSCLQVQLL